MIQTQALGGALEDSGRRFQAALDGDLRLGGA